MLAFIKEVKYSIGSPQVYLRATAIVLIFCCSFSSTGERENLRTRNKEKRKTLSPKKGNNLVYYFCRLKSGNQPKFSEVLEYILSVISLMTSHQWEESLYAVTQGLEAHKSFTSIL